MRKLARKGGLIWVILGILPLASFVNPILKLMGVDVNVIITIQLPLLFIQLFSLFMMIKYREEIF